MKIQWPSKLPLKTNDILELQTYYYNVSLLKLRLSYNKE